MKGSTLHRSGLTREKMGVLASFTQSDVKKQNTRAQLNQYYRTAKAQELDLLWGNVQKGIQKVHNVTKATQHKSPAVYLLIGFISGVLFMNCIILIVSLVSINPRINANVNANSSVAVIGEDNSLSDKLEPVISQERYIVKSGDTLNGIAYKFYGRYEEAKILEIQRINNIINPAAIRVGQELLIPVSQER